MRLLRGLAGVLLWVVALLLAIVALLLCVTVLLIPLGLPLLGYARRLFTFSVRLMFPGTTARASQAKSAIRRVWRSRRRAYAYTEKCHVGLHTSVDLVEYMAPYISRVSQDLTVGKRMPGL